MRQFVIFFLGLFSLLISCGKEPKKANVILMLADDMGYSDISAFGGDINTPNIDRLFNQGIAFTQFYNGARCCPTRASLVTGTYAQQAGVGYMTKDWEEDGYRGHLDTDVVTLGEVMAANGYTTFHTGKWHIGNLKNEQTPVKRGFDKSWWRQGKINYFDASPGMIYLNDSTWTTQDTNYYLTDYTANFTMQFLEEAVASDKPFFGYVAWDACHWPLQAKDEHIKIFKDKYSQGWDEIRNERLKNQEKLGLISPEWKLNGRDEAVPAWEDEASEKQKRWSEKMAVYAAQLYSLDENIGRVMQKLEELGEDDNTYIMLLFDNGACAEAIGWKDTSRVGSPESYTSYNMPWANVSNTPFKSYKHFLYEGGISTPFVVFGPGLESGTTKAVGHITDVMPTILDLVNGHYINRNGIVPMQGESLVPALEKRTDEGREWVFWEHEGNRAVRYGDWKLVSRYVNDTVYFNRWHFPKSPRAQEWELYNIKEDRTEQFDVLETHPELVAKMKKKWEEWANKVGVIQGVSSYDWEGIKKDL